MVDLCLFEVKDVERIKSVNIPQFPVKAVSSILNLGSPKPPVDTLPLRLDICWISRWDSKNWSIFPRKEMSSPLTTFSVITLKTREASRIQVKR